MASFPLYKGSLLGIRSSSSRVVMTKHDLFDWPTLLMSQRISRCLSLDINLKPSLVQTRCIQQVDLGVDLNHPVYLTVLLFYLNLPGQMIHSTA